MITDTRRLEEQALKLSIVGAAGMAILGIVFAFLTRSEAIMLDGLFSLIGFAMGWFSLQVSRRVIQPDDEVFQFGYASLEPLVNTIKGLLMAFLGVFALYSAVQALLHGGRPIVSGYALMYAIFVAVVCFVIFVVQRRAATRTHSPLVEVDARGWLIDGLLTVAVCLAFGVVVFIEKTAWALYVPYADPLIVIGLVGGSAFLPVRIIRTNLRELLLAAPAPDFQRQVRDTLGAAIGDFPIANTVLRMVKVGRSFYLQVYVVVAPSHGATRLDELDTVRIRIMETLRQTFPDLGIDVLFTREPQLVRPVLT